MTAEDTWPFGGPSFSDQAFTVAADAYARTTGSWERAVFAAIDTLFQFLADNPRQTTICIVDEEQGASEAALDRRDADIDRFLPLLEPGFVAADPRPPWVVAEAIGGSIYEMVRGHVQLERLDLLPDSSPDATAMALVPFMGVKPAIKFATETAMETNRW